MKLLTKAIKNKLPKLGEQDGLGMDAIVHVKFFNPTGCQTWLITEFDGEDTMFGYAYMGDWDCAELGYVSFNELSKFRGRFTLGIERDRYFKPKPLTEAIEELKRQFG